MPRKVSGSLTFKYFAVVTSVYICATAQKDVTAITINVLVLVVIFPPLLVSIMRSMKGMPQPSDCRELLIAFPLIKFRFDMS